MVVGRTFPVTPFYLEDILDKTGWYTFLQSVEEQGLRKGI